MSQSLTLSIYGREISIDLNFGLLRKVKSMIGGRDPFSVITSSDAVDLIDFFETIVKAGVETQHAGAIPADTITRWVEEENSDVQQIISYMNDIAIAYGFGKKVKPKDGKEDSADTQ